MFSLSKYIYFILLYTRRAILTQTNQKSVQVEKKLDTYQFIIVFELMKFKV